ncbi:hypothetical protein CPB84DRAFT_755990 [Gymnopilus junonius]|uniref:C3H1-type domain-containing protein n=1 Tax=Gymnopilus junonius TaxID=109634 RepID=A0A9P5NZM8_GYMJU|nr:hypothetical protein CPB84DRAFT_755990 [Gymnopilus junonius]
MALPDPSWRVKTRPCPFYQQGKCLFAESCNFLHNVSATVIPEAKASKTISQDTAGPSTPLKPPCLVIDSPHSVRSPPRSPRTASLLYALRDVIGDPDDEDASLGSIIPPRASHDDENTWSESLPTLVNESGFGLYSRDESPLVQSTNESHHEQDGNFEGDWTAISDYEDGDDQRPEVLQEDVDQPDAPFFDDSRAIIGDSAAGDDALQTSLSGHNGVESLSTESTIRYSINSERTSSGLLSPIELSTLNLGALFHVNDTNSSDTANTWRPPIPLLASPPRSPSISSTFDLLSSPFGSHSARVISPHLNPFMPRSPVSPARTVSPAVHDEIEPLDLGLDSPNNYHKRQQSVDTTKDEEHEIAVVIDEDTLLSELSAEQPDAYEEDGDEEEIEHDSYGHTSIWENEDRPTVVFVGDSSRPLNTQAQVEEAVRRSSITPTHFLAHSEPLFQDSEVSEYSTSVFGDASQVNVANTTASDIVGHNHDDSFDEDATSSSLAYLRSPSGPPPNENDTLTSLYDVYSDIQESPPNPSVRQAASLSQTLESHSPSNPSTPASLRERVFTPPPVSRTRSGTITADSPNSVASPMTSLDSVSRGRASPFSVADIKSPRRESERQSPVEESEQSRKVPFGFRNSFTLEETSSGRSSPAPSRSSHRSVPPSPLREQTTMPESEPQLSPQESLPNTQTLKGLKPLRLSTIVDAKYFSRTLIHSRMSSSSSLVNSFHPSGISSRTSISSSVSSSNSVSDNRLLSSARSSLLPLNVQNTLIHSEAHEPSPLSLHLFENLVNLEEEPRLLRLRHGGGL